MLPNEDDQSQSHQPPLLQYAQHRDKRPPMYAMVLSILAAAFLIGCGGLFLFGCVAITIDTVRGSSRRDAAPLFVLLLIFPLGAVQFVAGWIQLAGVIRQLRGVYPHDTTVERTFGILNRQWFTGQPRGPRRG